MTTTIPELEKRLKRAMSKLESALERGADHELEAEKLETEIAKREAKVDQLRDALEAARLDINPLEQLHNGTVIEFALTHEPYGRGYEFVGRKIAGRWFVTGRRCPPGGYSSIELVELIRRAFAATDVRVMKFERSIEIVA
jgi:hypothetical protein